MLRVDNIHTFYGQIEALKGISLHVNKGEIVSMTDRKRLGFNPWARKFP